MNNYYVTFEISYYYILAKINAMKEIIERKENVDYKSRKKSVE